MNNKANLGQSFEALINAANNFYYQKGTAVITKIPTPFKIIRQYNPFTQKKEVTGAFPEQKSIVDYIGIAAGNFLAFEAKSTANKTNFPLKEVKEHQRAYLNAVSRAGAVSFLLIECKHLNCIYRLMWEDLKRFEENHKRKSIPFDWLQEYGYKIQIKQGHLHYLEHLTLYDNLTGAFYID